MLIIDQLLLCVALSGSEEQTVSLDDVANTVEWVHAVEGREYVVIVGRDDFFEDLVVLHDVIHGHRLSCHGGSRKAGLFKAGLAPVANGLRQLQCPKSEQQHHLAYALRHQFDVVRLVALMDAFDFAQEVCLSFCQLYQRARYQREFVYAEHVQHLFR